ncbi:Leucine rich repeat-containing protein [Prevotellaceae bacterium HUN156]|nr:Leucine rich repeat-containing protein [Prevotellaceae bacterium HUN156]
MKQKYLLAQLSVLFCMICTNVLAYDIEVANDDGVMIYYNYINNGLELEVTNNGEQNGYSDEVIIPEKVTLNGQTLSVTRIGEGAFWRCPINFVTIPKSVTSIGSGAFSYCTNLTYIIIPNNVTSIESRAFRGCSRLNSISIPNSVMRIGSEAFDGTAWYANQPDGLVYAGKNVYKYKGTMPEDTSIIINEGTYSITGYAFENCDGLSSITIPNSVTSIGVYAFDGCEHLSSISIPNGITSIGSSMFRFCRSLSSIIIPNGVTSIGSETFYGCSSLSSINIPNSVTSIGFEAFAGTAWYANQPDGLVYAGKNVYDYKGIMPENTSLLIKEGTLSIAGGAFSERSCLSSITIPNSVTSIGVRAFYNCSSLSSINIPNSVKDSISSATFSGCSKLKSVILGNGITTIGVAAFSCCTSLTSITIPNNVTRIGTAAFYNCSALTSITIPNSVTSIGSETFYGCSSLSSINIPNSVTSIGTWAFSDCSSLSSITIGNSVTSIERGTFEYCSSLTSITIPNSVTSIGDIAFNGCPLVKVELNSKTLVSKDYSVDYNMKDIFNAQVEEYILGEEVTSIGSNIFNGCLNIKTIDISSAVSKIGKRAFYGLVNLTDVTCRANMVPTTDKTAFDLSNIENAELHVPKASLTAYQETTPWSNFGIINSQIPAEVIVPFATSKSSTIVSRYDLNGHQISQSRHGLNIIHMKDGTTRKVVVK